MESVSAFAVYSGHVNLSKNQKRRSRKKILGKNLTSSNKKINQNKIHSKKVESPFVKNKNLKSILTNVNVKNSTVKKVSPTKDRAAQKILNGKKNINEAKNDVNKSPLSVKKVSQNQNGKLFNKDLKKRKRKKPVRTNEDTKENRITPTTNNSEKLTTLKTKIVNTKTNLNNSFNNEDKTLKKKKINKKHKIIYEEAKKIIQEKTSSELDGKKMLAKIIHPISVEHFMRDTWEKHALYIPKEEAEFQDLISSKMIDELVRKNVVLYGKHLDVTSYTNGMRETHNPEGRVHAHVMWDYYSNGCSIRMLNPQYFVDGLHSVLATLQEYFGCLVGANAYLTPPNSQGFAPHYDDIEAFVIQIEGRKSWKVYAPRSTQEALPCLSSRNFTDDEIGRPILEETLKPGDILYFPRGFVHQAKTVPGYHSLHVTISTYQRTAWCDLLQKALPLALMRATSKNVEFRKGLPIGYLKQAGLGYPKVSTKKDLIVQMKKLMNKLENYLDIDSAVDKMAAQFMHDALPPVFTPEESKCCVFEGGMTMTKNGKLKNNVQLDFDTKVRLSRANCCRLILEDVAIGDMMEEQLRVYFTLDNSREYHAEEPQFLVLPPEMSTAVQLLISSYPSFVRVSSLPCESDETKINLASDLWERGLLMSDKPLEVSNNIQEENETNNEIITPNEMISETESESEDSENEFSDQN